MKNEIIKFEYQGYVSGNVPVLLNIEYERYNPEKISTELILLGSDEKFGGAFRASLNGDEYGDLKIGGKKATDPEVMIRNINGWRHQGNNASLHIQSYEYAISENPINDPETIYVTVELTHSGILHKWCSKKLNWNGSIECKNVYSEEIEWDLDIGKGKDFARYNYEDHRFFDNKSTIQNERQNLEVEINTNLSLSTSEIKNTILEEVRDISLILSLCYRKLVSWYEIKFLLLPKDRNLELISPIMRKKFFTNAYPEHVDELINHRDLINGGLSTLVKNFRESLMIEALRRTITFLVSSQSNQTIELKFCQSIISLEAFCDCFIDCNQDSIKIPPSVWKKIEKKLRETIKLLNDQKEMSDYLDKVTKKLPELKSITTLDKILFCSKTLGVNTEDLWQKDGFEVGLNKALNMRNHLFHRAYCEDPYFLYANFIRIQVLTERLILKHLKWPNEKIWRYYDQEMRRARIDI